MFMEYMRQNEYSTALLKKVLLQVTGEHYAIGPYKKQPIVEKTEEKPSGVARLESFGIPIEY